MTKAFFKRQLGCYLVLALFAGFVDGVRADSFYPNDPYFLYSTNPTGFPGQWHLLNTAPLGVKNTGVDSNVVSAWRAGYTGSGVVIGIVDTGMDRYNYDIAPNYRSDLSYDFINGSSTITLAYDDDHGTSVAGVAAGRGGNARGGTGAAPSAYLADLRLISSGATTQNQIDSCYWKGGVETNGTISSEATIHIKNHSYGYTNQYVTLSSSVSKAIALTSSNGVIHVFSAGNDRGKLTEDSNKSPYLNNQNTLVVAALGSDGAYATYSSKGTSVFVTAPSSSDNGYSIITADRVGSAYGYNSRYGDTFPDRDYTSIFGGTSSAAPLMSGILALGKEANPNLDLRTAKHALANTSTKVDSSQSDWAQNNAGYWFNPNYGFGNVNAYAFAQKAQSIAYITDVTYGTASSGGVTTVIPAGGTATVTFVPTGTQQSLEGVNITLSLTHTNRGGLEATLTSPKGTTSKFLTTLSSDATTVSNWTWSFQCNNFWGENPNLGAGSWTLNVTDTDGTVGTGVLESYSIELQMGEMSTYTAGANTLSADVSTRAFTLNNSASTYDIPAACTLTVWDNVLVKNGELTVKGTIAENRTRGAIVKVEGGILSGTGSINVTRGLLNSYGIVRPGASGTPGTLTLTQGNFQQTAGGTLDIQVASALNYSKLSLSGTAYLGGNLTLSYLGGYKPTLGTTLTGVIQNAAGISNSFDSVTRVSPVILWVPSASATALDLTLTRCLDNPALNLNPVQKDVARALSTSPNIDSGDLGNVINAIGNLGTEGEVRNAYNEISASKLTTMAVGAFDGAQVQYQNVRNHLFSLRDGSTRAAMVQIGDTTPAGKPVLLAYSGPDVRGLLNVKEEEPERKKWDYFINASGTFGDQEASNIQPGYNYWSAGMTTGIGYFFSRELTAGLATGFSRTMSDLNGSGGHVKVDTIPIWLYSTYQRNNWYLDAMMGGGVSFYDLKRNIQFGTIDRQAYSDPNGYQVNARLETGMDHQFGHLTIGPSLSVQYTKMWIDSFTERNADSLNLSIARQTADSIQNGIGIHSSYRIKMKTFTLVPHFSGSFQHEWRNDSRMIDAQLAQGSSIFQAPTDAPDRNFGLVGGGLTAEISESLSLRVSYETEVGKTDYARQTFSGGVDVLF
ncbi:MAG: autotransporter domain-containing protein [Verrucomicrobiae bacterium]|nr:autotransporter domain-containing protein [Verrucomicrobiae bacterium]